MQNDLCLHCNKEVQHGVPVLRCCQKSQPIRMDAQRYSSTSFSIFRALLSLICCSWSTRLLKLQVEEAARYPLTVSSRHVPCAAALLLALPVGTYPAIQFQLHCIPRSLSSLQAQCKAWEIPSQNHM